MTQTNRTATQYIAQLGQTCSRDST